MTRAFLAPSAVPAPFLASLACAATFALTAFLAAPGLPAQAARPAPGDQVADVEFLDIRYLRRSLSDIEGKRACVLFFVTNDCPLVLRYLPVVARLERQYRDGGVQFLAVNVGAADTIVEMAACAVEHEIAFPFVKDEDGRVARALGVERTASVVILDAGRRLRYRGRVDQQYRFGGVRPDPGRADLQLALDAVLAGSRNENENENESESETAVAIEVEVPETPVEGCAITFPALPDGAGLTWTEHIAPIVQAHCQDCHRPGGEAPFALMDYADVASRAAMIAEVVAQRRMPPWYASAKYGKFANHRGLDTESVQKIVGWVAAGRREGAAGHLPSPRVFPERIWRIDAPDLVLKLPFPVRLPAEGYVPYKYFVFPYLFTADTWVEQIEILPENKRVLHHANIAYVKGLRYSPAGFLTGQVPGGDPMVLEPGTALKIPAGSVIGIQCHYVTTGKPEIDRLRIGIRFPRGKVRRQLHHLQLGNLKFAIPPHAPHHRVSRTKRLPWDVEGLGMFAHMHLRGKDMTFTALYPDGQREKLLLVPNYSFDWQQSYRWPRASVFFPAGTRIQVDAHFDNSAFNPFNPDPTRRVPYGEETADEMMFGFLFYYRQGEDLDLGVDPETGRELP